MTCTPFKNSFKIASTSREMVLYLHLPSWPTDALCSTRHAIVPPTEGYEDGQGIGFSVLLEVPSRATAATATHFLHKLVSRMPFPVKAIQVDGGSEFMADFEGACQGRGIKLFISATPLTQTKWTSETGTSDSPGGVLRTLQGRMDSVQLE